MYIIAKNKDYYDGVVGSVGMDKTLVYERSIKEITDRKKMLKEFQVRKTGWRDRDNNFLSIGYADVKNKHRKKSHKYDSCRSFIVGFCGKLYLGWFFYYKVKVRDEDGLIVDEERHDIIYGYENAKQFLEDSGYWNSKLSDDVAYVMSYDPIDMFRELKTPVFIYATRRDDALIINPILKEYEFYKVVDAFTAFQEISMFIGGVLGIGEKEIVEIEDKYKIPQHGFDKWSFRREPSKKKGMK